MAVETGKTVDLRLYAVRWICGKKEGCCWIRGLSGDDVAAEFHSRPSLYGAPHEAALAVTTVRETIAAPTDRATARD